MHFDPTITAGNVISLAGGIVVVVGAYLRISERLAILETKMELLLERRAIARY